MDLKSLKDKKIAILGMGIEGRAVYSYLKDHGHSPFVLDRADEATLTKKGIEVDSRFILGPDYLADLGDYDVIFRSPGIPVLTPEIQRAAKAGAVITSQLEYFFENTKAKIIGVTGTKGKGTTATLIYEILRKDKMDVYLAGNIGVPAIDYLDKLGESAIIILELSSFQLQTLEKSPEIAVVLNISSDHLDYHETIEEYREAKKNIIRYQSKDDVAVINADYQTSLEFADETKAKTYYFSKKKQVRGCYVSKGSFMLETSEGIIAVIGTDQLLLRGVHNQENVAAAILASYLAGAKIESIRSAVTAFRGLEHRLELVRERNGVRYYNDSFSTVPETAIAAIRSFKEPKILILGGSDKGSNYAELGKTIETSNTKAIIFIGDMAEKISDSIGDKYKGERIFGLKKMDDIVKKAETISQKNDVVLLSPACASFGLFENYKDRGNQFKEAVSSLG